jgi:hypothetical protein
VHLERLARHAAFGVDVLVIGAAGGQVVEQLDRADFDDAVAFGGLKPGGFGVENDFTHGYPALICRPTGPGRGAGGFKAGVSMMWVGAGALFASGIWRARIASNSARSCRAGQNAGALNVGRGEKRQHGPVRL